MLELERILENTMREPSNFPCVENDFVSNEVEASRVRNTRPVSGFGFLGG